MKKLILISTLLIGCLTPNIPPRSAEKKYQQVVLNWIDKDGISREVITFNTTMEQVERKFKQTYGEQYFAVISALPIDEIHQD